MNKNFVVNKWQLYLSENAKKNHAIRFALDKMFIQLNPIKSMFFFFISVYN